MCNQFLKDGYAVVVSDFRRDAAQEVAKTLDSTGEHVFIVSIDVGSS
jgi:NADP-dependent 3-hydroxy acid dehydrogenase YdfG